MSETNGNGRGPDGRFQPGGPPGPGRPSRASEAAFMRAVRRGCPASKLRDIAASLAAAALEGDTAAAALLFKALLPPPQSERERALAEAIAALEAKLQ